MTNQEVFALIKPMGTLTYSTIQGDEVHSRIAGMITADDEGFYFFALRNKPYARQLLTTGRVTICGSYTPPCEPNPAFKLRPGYAVRLIGEIREVTVAEIKEKAKNNPTFKKLLEYDYAKYPDTVTFVLYKGKGEIFDYDFNLEKRDHKLIRTRFSIGEGTFNPAGFKINANCIGCGRCLEACGYKSIKAGDPYVIMGEYCDECGLCRNICPFDAIDIPDVF